MQVHRWCWRRVVRSTGCCLAALLAAGRIQAAEPEWLRLQAPNFGVLSQLDADDTRQWAVEFERFIDSMHQLYSVENVDLPPLTMIIFKQLKEFDRYRFQTDSGQVKVAGFFSNVDTWSVIGLAGRYDEASTRSVIQHEAVHWFGSGGDMALPLWFQEGVAETLSTFRVHKGKGRWGEVIDNHVNYLAYTGLMPMEVLLRASQDDALHGPGAARYYPQAWLFTHYLMFGNAGADRARLATLIRLSKETDLETAFNTAFGKSYEDVQKDLQRYLQRGRYAYSETELRDRGSEMKVEPASAASVEFALARLAAAGGNYELATEHIDKVLQLAPNLPLGYEMQAFVANQTANDDVFARAADLAIERSSRDALVYRLKADRLIRDESREAPWDDALTANTARAAADLYARSLVLRSRGREAYRGLVTALLNVSSVTEADRTLVSNGRILYPTDGLIAVGEAAIAKLDGNPREAVMLLRRVREEPFVLLTAQRQNVNALHADWTVRWVLAEIETNTREGRNDLSRALLTEQLADDAVSGRARTFLQRVYDDCPCKSD